MMVESLCKGLLEDWDTCVVFPIRNVFFTYSGIMYSSLTVKMHCGITSLLSIMEVLVTFSAR